MRRGRSSGAARAALTLYHRRRTHGACVRIRHWLPSHPMKRTRDQNQEGAKEPGIVKRLRPLTVFSIVGSLIYAGFLVFVYQDRGGSAMSLNELGDFLAGVSSPIALLWLIIGYFQHGAELRINTQALKAQQIELEQQVKETSLLVETAEMDLKYRQEMDARRAAPVFMLGPSSDVSDDRARLIIVNRGAEVYDAEIEYHGSHKCQSRMAEVLGGSIDHYLQVYICKEGKSPILPIRLNISYRTRLGDEGNREYEIVMTEGRLEAVSLDPDEVGPEMR